MYAAGAGGCFDILSVQGYGLWSGPTDHRLRPLIVNYGRNQFIRDIMVRHGDEHKAIWISEMNWNAVPPDSGIVPNFGQVTEEQQARYAPQAYQRAQEEWPWVGMIAFWFFKRADNSEANQAWYYFRMAEPDFTLLPVYASMQVAMAQPPVMHLGWFQEDHWAVAWSSGWQTVADPGATLGAARAASAPGESASFTFDGTELLLVVQPGRRPAALTVTIDDGAPQLLNLPAGPSDRPLKLPVVRGLPVGPHAVTLTLASGEARLDGFIVRRAPNLTTGMLLGIAAILIAGWYAGKRSK